jgi:hypothetical protein
MNGTLSKPLIIFLFLFISCGPQEKKPLLDLPDLKRGEIISCSPAGEGIYGTVSFTATVPDSVRSDFNKAIALLHSFEYDESEKMFARVIDRSPDCAMAYWGVAMSNFHPLWAPPGASELEKGSRAIEIARSLSNKTKRESDYIEAIARYYENHANADHRSRVLLFEKAMQTVYETYREDKEAVVFYALALNSAADPTDKSYSRQRKALSLLIPLFQEQPLHPGLAHYIIHNADYPLLAELALPAAIKYASIAPASAHAQHMPSHIFTRLGLWDKCIESNLVSVSSARCYAEQAKIKGHWDEELHGLDYLVYAYLQKGDDEQALKELNYLKTIKEVSPLNFKTAYAFAAIPSRYVLERKKWEEAASMEVFPVAYPWEKFPWQKSIFHFARLLGFVNLNKLKEANSELDTIKSLYQVLHGQKEKAIEAKQVEVQIRTAEAWILFKQGKNNEALALMNQAADLEDGMEKHPVTPGEVIPARELLADMLAQMDQPSAALETYEACLRTHSNRFNSLQGAANAARMKGDKIASRKYDDQLMSITKQGSIKKRISEKT